jgi:hypothetical protein
MTTHAIYNLSNSQATLVTPNGVHSGMDITIQNVNSSGFVYIGGETVTSSDYGYRISPGQAWSVELSGRDSIYAVSNNPGAVIAVLNFSLEEGN